MEAKGESMEINRKFAVIGLGYVGLTTAVALSKLGKVVAFDTSEERIKELQQGIERNGEVDVSDLSSKNLFWTANSDDLNECDFYVITVPTPIGKAKRPIFTMLFAATENIGTKLKKGDIVVYESSVYPGMTEEHCIPRLEKASGLICGQDFGVGYSPERINPSDKVHTFHTIAKIEAGTTLNPTIETVKKIADALGISLDDLMK